MYWVKNDWPVSRPVEPVFRRGHRCGMPRPLNVSSTCLEVFVHFLPPPCPPQTAVADPLPPSDLVSGLIVVTSRFTPVTAGGMLAVTKT